jgi:hypothetical protein
VTPIKIPAESSLFMNRGEQVALAASKSERDMTNRERESIENSKLIIARKVVEAIDDVFLGMTPMMYPHLRIWFTWCRRKAVHQQRSSI